MSGRAMDTAEGIARLASVVRRYVGGGAQTRLRPRLVDELVAPGGVMHRPEVDLAGIAAVRAFVAAVTNVARHESTIHDLFGAGDRVVARLSHVVSYTGDEPTRVGVVHAAGKTVAWDAIAIFRFDQEGKVVEEWVARDEVAMLLQFGAIAPPRFRRLGRSWDWPIARVR
jgi:predicted ester cyclase